MTPRTGSEDGASSIASVFGVAIFLGFLFLATQVLVHLYAISTVNAVAFDHARRAAAEGGDCATAAVNAASALGSWGSQPGVSVTCVQGEHATTLRITGPSPAAGLQLYGELTGQAMVERGSSVRTEGW